MALTREQLQFGVLLLCVPLQYFAVQYFNSNEVSRSYEISKMMTQFKTFNTRWFRVDSWKQWCTDLYHDYLREARGYRKNELPSDTDNGESPAFEVLKYREREGHFASSAEIRNPKSPQVQYRVGQVVKHKKWGYHGVIIGWDEYARAPEDWIKQMHGENVGWREQPNFSILVDTRDRAAPQVTYVPQENLEVVRQITVFHPLVDEYFEKFDGSQYLPRPWLKGLYPRD